MASFPADDLQGNKTRAGSGGGEGPVRPPEQGLKCPRCDSPNTKFCYYNNYSLAQPRYFCKTCRRYWTKGGALRNVPVGGGCRKTKKSKSSSIPATSSSGAAREHRFLQGLSSVVDFHLPSGLNHTPSGPGIFNMIAADGGAGNHLISYGDLSCSNAAALPSEAAGAIASPLIGFKYPIQLAAPHFTGMDLVLGNGGEATTTPIKGGDLAASIESLSSINQGLHWKLQQQRLASFFGGEDLHHHPYQGKGITDNTHALLEVPNRPFTSCPMTTVSSREKDSTIGSTTGWFLENSGGYTASTAADHRGNVNNVSVSAGNNAAGNSWNGIQTWSGMHHLPFSALP